MKERLNELSQLEDGWFDGEGLAPLADSMSWLEEAWCTHAAHLPEPYIYPTLEGGLSLEWDKPGNGLTLELDLATKQGRASLEEAEEVLDLGTEAGWLRLAALLQQPAMHS